MDEQRSTTRATGWGPSRSVEIKPNHHHHVEPRDYAGGALSYGRVPPGQMTGGCVTYKFRLAGVDERFGGEPFPHESARGSAVDRVDQPANVVVD